MTKFLEDKINQKSNLFIKDTNNNLTQWFNIAKQQGLFTPNYKGFKIIDIAFKLASAKLDSEGELLFPLIIDYSNYEKN